MNEKILILQNQMLLPQSEQRYIQELIQDNINAQHTYVQQLEAVHSIFSFHQKCETQLNKHQQAMINHLRNKQGHKSELAYSLLQIKQQLVNIIINITKLNRQLGYPANPDLKLSEQSYLSTLISNETFNYDVFQRLCAIFITEIPENSYETLEKLYNFYVSMFLDNKMFIFQIFWRNVSKYYYDIKKQEFQPYAQLKFDIQQFIPYYTQIYQKFLIEVKLLQQQNKQIVIVPLYASQQHACYATENTSEVKIQANKQTTKSITPQQTNTKQFTSADNENSQINTQLEQSALLLRSHNQFEEKIVNYELTQLNVGPITDKILKYQQRLQLSPTEIQYSQSKTNKMKEQENSLEMYLKRLERVFILKKQYKKLVYNIHILSSEVTKMHEQNKISYVLDHFIQLQNIIVKIFNMCNQFTQIVGYYATPDFEYTSIFTQIINIFKYEWVEQIINEHCSNEEILQTNQAQFIAKLLFLREENSFVNKFWTYIENNVNTSLAVVSSEKCFQLLINDQKQYHKMQKIIKYCEDNGLILCKIPVVQNGVKECFKPRNSNTVHQDNNTSFQPLQDIDIKA